MESTSMNEARGALTAQVLAARTLAEIAAARQALRDWLTTHPEEDGMRWGFEQLAQMQEIAETEAGLPAETPRAASVP